MNKNDMLGTIKEVKKNIINTDYPLDNIKFVKIDVRSTEKLKNSIQENIALLRLDTDFYDSTISILEALYDQVNKNGYIIHDDYGHWKGHYEACKKFFETRKINPVLKKDKNYIYQMIHIDVFLILLGNKLMMKVHIIQKKNVNKKYLKLRKLMKS